MVAEVVTLHESNFRDPAAALRKMADEIEAGEYGAVGVVIMGDTVEVFGAGEDAEPCSTAMLLHAGFLRLSQMMADHGRP